ncbi:zinc-ribbon domain-containing protein [Bacillus mojavensis]|uniref:zinc-ribbon domain-containing protein n=1 Tax=Bacillus mojavensis TaxID=72360 RepID=UPI002DB59160|nr:zinc-ribbon domain-containing protein [Bacillus mojavensis]MEC1634174.1 zinc-ribbon domain-containing protein [Bacillus mojavensis]
MKKSFTEEFPQLLSEWDYKKNGNLSPYKRTTYGRKIVWWKCGVGHSYSAQLSH